MVGYIILRDIPKKRVQLDLTYFDIRGGFRGFTHVPPGPHYISIEVNDEFISGFWCFVKPSEVLVKVYDDKKNEFNNDSEENEEHFSKLALTGAMNKAFISVMQLDAKMMTKWLSLVSHIEENEFPPKINSETMILGSSNEIPKSVSNFSETRFENTFEKIHNNNQKSYLAEFQFAFINFLVNSSEEQAKRRWLYLLTITYNARERSMEKYPNFFVSFIEVLINQMKFLPDDDFSSDGIILNTVNYFIEDLIDTGINELKNKADEFQSYLTTRGLLI